MDQGKEISGDCNVRQRAFAGLPLGLPLVPPREVLLMKAWAALASINGTRGPALVAEEGVQI